MCGNNTPQMWCEMLDKVKIKRKPEKYSYITMLLLVVEVTQTTNLHKICLERHVLPLVYFMSRETNTFMTDFNFSKKTSTFQTAYLVVQHMSGMLRNFQVEIRYFLCKNVKLKNYITHAIQQYKYTVLR